jgi:hypothetical protein
MEPGQCYRANEVAAGREQLPLARALLVSVSVASGIATLWYSVRIQIDRQLFATLADEVRLQDGEVAEALVGLDEALTASGWINAAKAGRPLATRVRGATRLLRGSVAIAVVQWLVVGIAIATRGL